jgi:hypothetical protein
MELLGVSHRVILTGLPCAAALVRLLGEAELQGWKEW